MRNPLENEETAFRFVLGTIAYLAPIVIASWIATWLGVTVFAIATAAAVTLLRRSARSVAPAEQPGRAAVGDTWRVLVLASETLGSSGLTQLGARLGAGVAKDVLLVYPLPSSATSGTAREGDVRGVAEERLRSTLADLVAAGVNAHGRLFDGEPLAALQDALADFAPDEVVISTTAEEPSSGRDQRLVDAARAQFDGIVTHVVESRLP